jgi:hypothetical protein
VRPVTGSRVEKILKFLLKVREFFSGSIRSLTVVFAIARHPVL